MYFANNLPYAQRIEEGYGVNPNYPSHFVEKATKKWNKHVKSIANKQKNK